MSNLQKPIMAGAALVEFGYYTKDEHQKFSVMVPARLFWEADDLAVLYRTVQAAKLANPGEEGFDEDAWDSLHLIKAEETTPHLVIDWPDDGFALPEDGA